MTADLVGSEGVINWSPTRTQLRFGIKPVVFLGCGLPLILLAGRTLGWLEPGLGANPIETIQDELGRWGLRLVLVTLSATPLRWITGQAWPVALRRMLGLWAFTYCLLHFLAWSILDQGLAVKFMLEDVLERPFITIGFAALLMLIPLAVTSTAGWRRRLGSRWSRLHRLIYPIAILVIWHYWWQVKLDVREPFVYAAILVVLLGWRLARRRRRQAA